MQFFLNDSNETNGSAIIPTKIYILQKYLLFDNKCAICRSLNLYKWVYFYDNTNYKVNVMGGVIQLVCFFFRL